MSLLPLAKLIIPYSNFFNYFKNVILQLAYSYENSNQVHTLHLVISGTQSKTLPWKSSLSWPFVFKSLICWRKQHLSYRISHTFLCLLMPSLVVIFNFLLYPPDFLYPRLQVCLEAWSDVDLVFWHEGFTEGAYIRPMTLHCKMHWDLTRWLTLVSRVVTWPALRAHHQPSVQWFSHLLLTAKISLATASGDFLMLSSLLYLLISWNSTRKFPYQLFDYPKKVI